MDGLSIAERLGDILQERHIKQYQLAEKTGLSPSLISDFLNEESDRKINHEAIIKICEALDISADYLLGLSRKDVKTRDPDARFVAEYTGLSDTAILELRKYNDTDLEIRSILHTIDILLTTEHGKNVIENIDSFLLTDFSSAYVWEDENDIFRLRNNALFFHKRDNSEIHLGLNVDMLQSAILDIIRDELKKIKDDLQNEKEGDS